jgi:uncharacterized surface protein with fasciclin (FAS1) repeats
MVDLNVLLRIVGVGWGAKAWAGRPAEHLDSGRSRLMQRFNRLTVVMAIGAFALAALVQGPALAHCGSCGAGDHSHDKKKKDIVDTAASKSTFSTLVKAVKAADLASTLKGEGPFTVFAPTNKAFGQLPEGTLQSLLKPENQGKLQSVLKYHVVPGKVMASDVAGLDGVKSDEGASVATAEGSKLTIKVQDGSVMVDGAKVTSTDIETSNGVIHVVDGVLLPKSE